MPLTELTDYTGYEVSLVPLGANKKKRFLVTKEHGELAMDKLLEQILKEGLKDEGSVDKVVKNLGMNEEEGMVLKAIMKMVGGDKAPLSKEKLMKALDDMGEKSPEQIKKMEEEEEEKKEKIKKAEEEEAAAIKKAKEEEEEVNKNLKGGTMPAKVPVLKEDGSWDLSGVDENLRPALEVVCKSNEMLTKTITSQELVNKSLAEKLKTEQDARVLKEFEVKAQSYGHLGDDATALAKVLKSAHDADPKNCEAIEMILKSANAKIEEGNLFKEAGATSTTMHGATAWTKIEKMAEGFETADPSLSKADAIDLVLKKHPELYDEYSQEKRRA